jgi:prepilin-type processing-associated H-X9-DG protein
MTYAGSKGSGNMQPDDALLVCDDDEDDIPGSGILMEIDDGSEPTLRIRDVIDGTSNTFLAGEIKWEDDDDGGITDDDDHNCWIGACDSTDKHLRSSSCRHPINQIRKDDGGDAHGPKDAFGSWHSGGAHFLFADGAVKFLKQDIDISPGGIYERLGARSDMLPISGGF